METDDIEVENQVFSFLLFGCFWRFGDKRNASGTATSGSLDKMMDKLSLLIAVNKDGIIFNLFPMLLAF